MPRSDLDACRPRPRPRGYRRSVLLAPLVLLLSLVVVFSNPTQARASTMTPIPPTVWGAAKVAAPRLLLATSPVGLAISAAMFAYIVYQERDTFMPLLEKIKGLGDGLTDMTSPHTATYEGGMVLEGVSGAWGSFRYDRYEATTVASADAVIWMKNGRCRDADTGAEYTFGNPANTFGQQIPGAKVQVPAGGARSATGTFNLCPAGGTEFLSGEFWSVESTTAYGDHFPPFSYNIADVQQLPDSQVEVESVVECYNPGTGDFVTITGTELGHPERLAVPSCKQRLGAGYIPWSTSVGAGPQGGPYERQLEVTTKQDVFDEYADCFGPTGLVCEIAVHVDGNACTIGETVCTRWRELSQTRPDRVTCKFGSHAVPLAECEVLRYAYQAKPHTITRVETETAPDGSVKVVPAPPETDPDTPVPNPEDPKDPDDPTFDLGGCIGAGTNLNPLTWVYVPVKCVVIWAFKPRTQLSLRVDTIKATFTGKVPFSWFSGFSAIPAAVPAGACPDWTVKVGGLSENVVCNSTYTDAIRTSRPVLLVFMGALAVWPLLRSTMYAAFPILKPQPGMLR